MDAYSATFFKQGKGIDGVVLTEDGNSVAARSGMTRREAKRQALAWQAKYWLNYIETLDNLRQAVKG